MCNELNTANDRTLDIFSKVKNNRDVLARHLHSHLIVFEVERQSISKKLLLSLSFTIVLTLSMVWSQWFILLLLSLRGHHSIFIGYRRTRFSQTLGERLPSQFESRSAPTKRSDPIQVRQQSAAFNSTFAAPPGDSDDSEELDNATLRILSDNLDLDLSENVIVSSLSLADPSPSETSYNMAANTMKYKTQQLFNDIPIFGASLVIEENLNTHRRRPIFGHWYDPKEIAEHIADVTPSIDNGTAIDIALDALSITESDLYAPITPKLWIYYPDTAPSTAALSWILRPIDYGLDASAMVVVDAISGDIYRIYNDSFAAHSRPSSRGVSACGIGGNTKIGKKEYCTPISEDNSDWILANDRVIVFDNNGQDNDEEDLRDAEPVECSMDSEKSTKCEIEDDKVNGAYCPVCK